MRRILALSTGIWVLLAVSLAFNVGFGSTLAVRKVRQVCGDQCGSVGAGSALCQSRVWAYLELTPEQSARFESAQQALLKSIAELSAELATERAGLGELLTADRLDEAAIDGQLDRICGVQKRIQQRLVTHLLAQRQQLSNEQRARYDELIRERICLCGEAGVNNSCEMRDKQGNTCNGHAGP